MLVALAGCLWRRAGGAVTVVRVVRLLHRRVRACERTFGLRRLRRHLKPARVTPQAESEGVPVRGTRRCRASRRKFLHHAQWGLVLPGLDRTPDCFVSEHRTGHVAIGRWRCTSRTKSGSPLVSGPRRSLVMRHMSGSLLTACGPLTGAEAVFTAPRPRGLNRTNHDESRERRSPASGIERGDRGLGKALVPALVSVVGPRSRRAPSQGTAPATR
jgi:hypothetical protein